MRLREEHWKIVEKIKQEIGGSFSTIFCARSLIWRKRGCQNEFV